MPLLSMMDFSDSDFDDEDDEELLLQLATQTVGKSKEKQNHSPVKNTPNLPQEYDEIHSKYIQTVGEVAIIRAQLELIQSQKQNEIVKLKEQQVHEKKIQDEQMNALRSNLQRLEDENKFLANEVKNLSLLKRRKISSNETTEDSMMDIEMNANLTAKTEESAFTSEVNINETPTTLKILKTQSESASFSDYLFSFCINGSARSTSDFLSRICLEEDLHVEELHIVAQTPLTASLFAYLLMKKHLRLDELVSLFALMLTKLIETLIAKDLIMAVPFLVSFVYASIHFRTTAVTRDLLLILLSSYTKLSLRYAYLLDSSQDYDDLINYYDKTEQTMILEKFTLICSLDVIERLMIFSISYGSTFIKHIWENEIISIKLFTTFLPDNAEKYKSSAQINILYNIVEILMSSITEDTFAFNEKQNLISNQAIFNSLLKVFLIELPIKPDFMFFGLTRIVGNNDDFKKINCIVPEQVEILGIRMFSTPAPIHGSLLKTSSIDGTNSHVDFEFGSKHDTHLLNLRLAVANVLETYIIYKESAREFESKEHIKSIIRTIELEQINLMRSPRSKNIHYRLQIISALVRILYYISQEVRGLTKTMFPETLYELFVVFLRIAFGSNSLSKEAHQLLKLLRKQKYSGTVFNKECEDRAREIYQTSFKEAQHTDGVLADIESGIPNGLEFTYDDETIEFAREILDSCITHDEADNLFLNMAPEENTKSEMIQTDS